MSASQREAHLKKVASAKLQENPASKHLHLSSQHEYINKQAGPSPSSILESQDVLYSDSSSYSTLPERNPSKCVDINQAVLLPTSVKSREVLHSDSSYSTLLEQNPSKCAKVNQAGPLHPLVKSQEVLHSDSSSRTLPEQNRSSYESLKYDEVSASNHLYRFSVPMASQHEEEAYAKPNCSRRLFVPVSQDQLLPDGDLQASYKTVSTHPRSTQCHFGMPSLSTSATTSTSQIQMAPNPIPTTVPTWKEDKLLSVAISDFSASVITPVEVLKAIWQKAYELLHEPYSISPAPGQGDKARMVRSYSGSRPHLVSYKKSGQYTCDSTCPNWKSLGICAHSVATAEDNQELQLFIHWYLKARKVPNLTKLATTEMPTGRGRKGSKAPPKKKPRIQPDSRVPFSVVAGVEDKDYNPSHHSSSASANLPQEPRTGLSASEIDFSHTRQVINSFSTGTATMIGSAESSLSPSNLIMNATHVSIHPQEVAYNNMPIVPPPLIHCVTPTTSPNTSPFILTFITGNIRVCRGCRQKYPKPPVPPLDLCVKHQEWQEFIGPSGMPQTRYGNVYYHCNIPCIHARNADFESSMLQIPATVLVQLLPLHTEYLSKHMPGRL